MKRILAVAVLALAFAGCAQLQQAKDKIAPSPEARIVNGGNLGRAASALATVTLKNKAITVAKAESYSGILHAAEKHMLVAEKTLIACRKATGSTPKTVPDPCEPSVAEDIALSESITRDVKRALDAKQ